MIDYKESLTRTNVLDQSNVLKGLVLISVLIVNATAVCIFWYYKSHRKNKSFITRYNLLHGGWCKTGRSFSSWFGVTKAILARLACVSLSSKLLENAHLTITIILLIMQTTELWDEIVRENNRLIDRWCLCLNRWIMWLSTILAMTLKLTSKKELSKLLKLFWRGEIVLWELFWFLN